MLLLTHSRVESLFRRPDLGHTRRQETIFCALASTKIPFYRVSNDDDDVSNEVIDLLGIFTM